MEGYREPGTKIGRVLNEPGVVLFYCAGCESPHSVAVNGHRNGNGASWEWNGSITQPTFTPSLMVTWLGGKGEHSKFVCHSFVREGNIQFLQDCTHALAGQTLDLPDWFGAWRD